MELFLQGLTQFTEDVIVDAANQQLEHSTGLAKAIADAGIVKLLWLHLYRKPSLYFAA